MKFRTLGEPIVSIVCYCDDCQAGARLVDALAEGSSGIDEDGGTPIVLFRKDRIQCFEGQDLLRAYNVRSDTTTDRVVASCCNTAMGSLFRNWFPHSNLRSHTILDNPYPPTVRILTDFATDPEGIPTGLPVHKGVPISVALQLIWEAIRLKLAARNPDPSWHDNPQRFEAGPL